ncbi:cupin domain-containing protein [Methylolobus aquaticus]
MNVTRNSELPRAALPGIENVTLAGSLNGLKNLSVWRSLMAPGAATPPHRHDCEEVVLIQSGHGVLWLNGQEHRFGPDSTLIVPRNLPHQILNCGDCQMELIGIFAVSPVEVFAPDGRLIELPWAT